MASLAERMVHSRVARVVATAAAFALLNRVGYYFQIDGGVSIFYPATAIDVIACMYFGPWGALGVFLGCLVTPWQAHETALQTSISGLLNVAEGMIPYLVFRARRSLFRDLHDFRSLVTFVLFGCVANSAVSALIGTELLVPPLTADRLFVWWVSDFSAALLLAMPVLAFAGESLERWFGLPEEKPRRTLNNAVAITGTIVLLGWAATTAIQAYLGEHIETVRAAEEARSLEVSRLLTTVHRAFDAGDLPRARALDEQLRSAARGTELASAAAALSVAIDARSPHAVVEPRLLALRDIVESIDARARSTYEMTRARCQLVTLLMQEILLLILLLAGVNVIRRIARPLHQMHGGVLALRRGEAFDRTRVESNLVEVRLLAETLEETSAELHAREEALREQTARAVAASKTKSEFLAKMSHELRTPLNSIIGFSELLLERGDATPREKRESFLQNVLRSAKNLLRLINDLLDMAKIEAGKMEFRYELVDVRDVVRNAVVAVTPLARVKEQRIEISMPDAAVVVRADPVRLEQVLLNLLSNANKFSREGTSIEILLRTDGDACELAVLDHGIGIREEDQALIFEDFTQLHAVPRAPGTGLGLGLAKRFVDAQGGTLTVESRVGEGSTFVVKLPLERRAQATA